MTATTTDRPELPEYKDNPFIARLPPLISTAEAVEKLIDLPRFNEQERQYPAHVRAHCVQRLAHYFEPLEQHVQLEAKFSTLLRQGYLSRNPLGPDFIHRLQNAHEWVMQGDLSRSPHRVRSTAVSFALIGCSGIGKSKGVERILELYPQVIHHTEPFSLQQVVWLKLDSPYMGSPKQLCMNFFQEMDLLLGTEYRKKHGSTRDAVDGMMIHVAEVANRHGLGVLIIDEIQHLRQAKGLTAKALLNFLVTLVNTIGIPVIVIGTLGSLPLLQDDFREARRASGLGSMVWERFQVGPTWNHFIEGLWRYQWLPEHSPLTDEIRHILYEESQGIIDVVVKLVMLGQMHAMQLGLTKLKKESLTPGLLMHVAKQNFQLIQPMIDALKRNDKIAIARYDDIRPFQDHVQQALSNAEGSMRPASTHVVRSSRAVPKQGKEGAADEAARNALRELGVAEDVAKLLMAEVEAENPGLSPLDLIASIRDKLRQRIPEPQPERPRKRPKKAISEPLAEDDLREIVARGKSDGLSGYDALLKAGVVKPPVPDSAA